jgi:8-oxo-dGTP pyrophosphatase MutT (NUDIX family)
MKTDIVQKALVLNRQGQLLLLRRSKTDSRRPLQWDLAGGLLDNGEEMIAGIKREIQEESGLQVSGVRAVFAKTEQREWQAEHGLVKRNVVYIFYTAKTSEAAVRLSYEHDSYRWVTLEEALNLIEYPLQKDALKHIIDKAVAL